MIHYIKGDIFQTACEAIVIPVNCVGVMGKGLALQFKKRISEKTFMTYQLLCNHWSAKNEFSEMKKTFVPGGVIPVRETSDKLYFLVATKDHWKFPSKLEWVDTSLKNLRQTLQNFNQPSIAIPPLGCGCGGLDWYLVRNLIEKHFGDYESSVEVYEPL